MKLHEPRTRWQTLTAFAAWLLTGMLIAFLLISDRILFSPISNIWFDDQRFGQLLCWSLAFLLTAMARPTTPLNWSIITVSLAMLLRAGLNNQPGWAIAEAGLLLGLTLSSAWICVARRSANASFDRTALFALVWFCLANSIMPLLIYARLLYEPIELPLSAIFYGFSNQRFFTQVQLLTIPLLALAVIAQTRTPAFRQLTTVAATLCWCLTFAAGTRALYAAMLGGAIVAWFWLGRIGRVWVKTQTGFALSGWVLFIIFFQLLPWLLGTNFDTGNARLSQIDTAFNSSGRIDMWIRVLGLIGEHPWLGIGPMQYAALPNPVAGGPHNVPLQFLLEWGIPLGCAMLAIPLIGLWKLGKLAKTGGELAPLRTCLFMTLLVAAIDSLFEGIISVPYSAALLAIMIGWAWGTFPEPADTSATRPSLYAKAGNWVTRTICLLLGVYLAWFALYPIDRLRQHNMDYLEISKSTLMPRMWAQGLINLEYDHRYPDRWFRTTPVEDTPPKSSSAR